MTVTEEIPGQRVRIEPDKPSALDYLEYADAAIDKYGWRQGERPSHVQKGGRDEPQSWKGTLKPGDGLSLHDAIGMAHDYLGDLPGHHSTRRHLADLVLAQAPAGYEGHSDITFNDKAGETIVRAALDAAIAHEEAK